MITTWQILTGECQAMLKTLPDQSVQCVVTSPPYWGLRDYGTAQWDGGDPACDHQPPPRQPRSAREDKHGFGTRSVLAAQDEGSTAYRHECGKCGARRIDSQIGLERSPIEYVSALCDVFGEVWRVLRDDGTVWLNLGDSYAGGTMGRNDNDAQTRARLDSHGHGGGIKLQSRGNTGVARPVAAGLKPKDLVGIPWRVAFALQAQGWYLRSDIIWSKPNPMPESVTDRPTKSHEYLFLLTKSERYFYDAEAIKEPASENTHPRGSGIGKKNAGTPFGEGIKHNADYARAINALVSERNKRSVWHVATQSFEGAHFATYPEKLIEPCILAGTSEKGQCPSCGAPWVRVVEREPMVVRPTAKRAAWQAEDDHARTQVGGTMIEPPRSVTTGWQPSCSCDAGEPVPQIVLDPFCGSGTTGAVAVRHQRSFIGCELNPSYVELARTRIGSVAPLLAREVA